MSNELTPITPPLPSVVPATDNEVKPPQEGREITKPDVGSRYESTTSRDDDSHDIARAKAQELFDRLTQGVLRTNARLSLGRDEETGIPVFKVIDASTDEIIRQWPMEEALALARRLQEDAEGLVVDKQV